jgi:phosphoglycolate phosphatase-like HAD superfamily hydrolase
MDLEPRQVLAELIDELSTALKSAQLPSDEVTHLAGTTMHLAEALHHQHDKGMLEKVRDRFEDATAQAEARAPVAVGLARRVLDALAQMGI